jgi:hypothetical protein
MGFINKLLAKGPGGPLSVAKAMLKAYNVCRSLNPEMTQTEVFREVMVSRYSVIRKMPSTKIESAVLLANSIGDLIAIVIFNDIPMAFSSDMFYHTLEALEKFYMQNAPDEIETVIRAPSIIRAWCS